MEKMLSKVVDQIAETTLNVVKRIDEQLKEMKRPSEKEEKCKDTIGAYWLMKENSECFNPESIFVVEIPVKDHKNADIIKVKKTEIENLENFDTFEEVKDTGQIKIGRRWVVTGKEKHNRQKTQFKARLVAKCYQEVIKPQSDSPTALNVKLIF
jgi:hypothetical protein